MVVLDITPGPLSGRVRLPGDIPIGHVTLVLAALAVGDSHLRGLHARRHVDLIDALAALGVEVSSSDEGVRVSGVGQAGFSPPPGGLEVEHSWTLALLAALLAPQPFGTRISARGAAVHPPVDAWVQSLRQRGALIAGSQGADGKLRAPVSVAPLLPGERLHEAEVYIPGADALTKAALLLSGLYVEGVTAVSEGMLSADHLERALLALGVPIQTLGSLVVLDRSAKQEPLLGFDWQVPADISLFALLCAAVLAQPGSEVVFEAVSVNPTRSGFLEALRHAGAAVRLTPRGDTRGGEPWAEVRVRAGALRSLRVGGELSVRMLGEVPALWGLAKVAGGRIQVRDVPPAPARNLRRMSAIARELGIESTAYEDGVDVDPGRAGAQSSVDCEGDAELASVALALGLSGSRPLRLLRAEGLIALYPNIVEILGQLGVSCRMEELA